MSDMNLLQWQSYGSEIDDIKKVIASTLEQLDEKSIISRIWDHDYSVWKPEPTEISNRLGWLDIAENMSGNVDRISSFAQDVFVSGYTQGLLLGMGGSSLAPELFGRTFSDRQGALQLDVLDSTDPAAVLSWTEKLEPEHTLFIVSSKSGGTVETLSLFKYFYNWLATTVGIEKTGAHFVAITDPGSPLIDVADKHDFRDIFINDPNIGGRYSALSYFGLVPAALVGVDLPRLLKRATQMGQDCSSEIAITDNPAAQLGAALGVLAKAGRDKVTLVTSPQITSFGDWVEQLIAESTGKSGTGILPVVREPIEPSGNFGRDRLFVVIQLANDPLIKTTLETLKVVDQPTLLLRLKDRYDLGGQFFLWELAVAIAGHLLGIHPFNQPNVESAKVRAREMVSEFQKTNQLPSEEPKVKGSGVALFGDVQGNSLETAIQGFLSQGLSGAPSPQSKQGYIALQAFILPTQENTDALQSLRLILRDRTGLATTLGYGPRYLHSTGQLQKGDSGQGLFIQITAEHPHDVAIPEKAGSLASSLTFGTLIHAQALGEHQALKQAGRRVLRIHLDDVLSLALFVHDVFA